MPATDSYSEKELLLKIAEGDEEAFAILYNFWSQRLAGYIYRFTNSSQVTEEVVQEVFLKIWTGRETLKEIREFKSYLFVVARNYAFLVLKQAVKKAKREAQAISEAYGTDTASNNDETDYYSIIDEAIDQLPSKRKEVYLLSRHKRMTYNEIASHLRISRESVKTHLRLASQSITDYIKINYPELLVSTMILISFF